MLRVGVFIGTSFVPVQVRRLSVTVKETLGAGGDPDKGHLGFGLGFDADARYGSGNIGAE
jgi:hypothetical protein